MIADAVHSFLHMLPSGRIIGKYLFDQFQFHQILQIDTDLGPGKSGIFIDIIKFMAASRKGRQDRLIDIELPEFLRQNPPAFPAQYACGGKDRLTDIILQAFRRRHTLPQSRIPA